MPCNFLDDALRASDEGYVVFRIMDVADTLDIRCVTDRIQEKQARGTWSHHPGMMLALLMYAYCSGIGTVRATLPFGPMPYALLAGLLLC